MDYSIDKDSTTAFYQLDFTANASNLNEYDELLSSGYKFYPIIDDLIIDKFGKDFSTNSKLKNSLLFIFPKEHLGRVKIDLVDNKLIAKITNLESEELQLKIQLKRSDTLELQHLEFDFDEKNLEKVVELDFIPDMLDGYLLDYIDEYPEYKVQKIKKRYDIIKSTFTNEKALRSIILEGEGLKTDFKLMYPCKEEKPRELKETKIKELICSFANSEGGVIIFGVNDEEAEIIGYDIKMQFDSQGDFEQHIQKLCNKELEPQVTAQVYKVEIDTKILQIVHIFAYTDHWVRVKTSKRIMIRKGSTTREATPYDLKKSQKEMNSAIF